jgi:hypothetical protein
LGVAVFFDREFANISAKIEPLRYLLARSALTKLYAYGRNIFSFDQLLIRSDHTRIAKNSLPHGSDKTDKSDLI